MKIIFLGTPQFAIPSLESLKNSGKFDIQAVITQSDKPVGRKRALAPTAVKLKALELGLQVLQPENQNQLFELLKEYQTDFFVVIAYGMILPKTILELPKYGAINVHASLLPKYRGASPIQETLLNGDKETGISIIKMNQKMDKGDIYFIKKIEISKNDDLPLLSNKLANLSAQVLPHVLEDVRDKVLSPIPQEDKKATYCRKIKKEDGEINFTKTAQEIKNMSRAYYGWPGIYLTVKGKRLGILKTNISQEQIPPGKFIVEKNSLKIGTQKGSILPEIVQLEGKKSMMINEFLNGFKHLLNL